MNKVNLIDFTGGFSEEIRPDLLADNVCQVVENCEVNVNGLLNDRDGFALSSRFPVGLGEVVAIYHWNTYYKLNHSQFEHYLVVARVNSEFRLYVWIPRFNANITIKDVGMSFTTKPSIAVTDREIWVLDTLKYENETKDLKKQNLQYIKIKRNGDIESGEYDVANPIGMVEVESKKGMYGQDEYTTSISYGSFLQYCFTYTTYEGLESEPSAITSYFENNFVWDNLYAKNIILKGFNNLDTEDREEIEYINIYRRHAKYSESHEGFTQFYLIAKLRTDREDFVDNVSENVVQLEEASYQIKGDDVVFLDNSLFISNGLKSLPRYNEGELIQCIEFDNTRGKGWINKIIILRIPQNNPMYSHITNSDKRKKTIFVDIDTRTPLETFFHGTINGQAVMFVEMPYIYPRAVHTIYVYVDCEDGRDWIEDIGLVSPSKQNAEMNYSFNVEIQVKDINCVQCFSGECIDSENNIIPNAPSELPCNKCSGGNVFVRCAICKGSGQRKTGKKHKVPCNACNFTGKSIIGCNVCGGSTNIPNLNRTILPEKVTKIKKDIFAGLRVNNINRYNGIVNLPFDDLEKNSFVQRLVYNTQFTETNANDLLYSSGISSQKGYMMYQSPMPNSNINNQLTASLFFKLNNNKREIRIQAKSNPNRLTVGFYNRETQNTQIGVDFVVGHLPDGAIPTTHQIEYNILFTWIILSEQLYCKLYYRYRNSVSTQTFPDMQTNGTFFAISKDVSSLDDLTYGFDSICRNFYLHNGRYVEDINEAKRMHNPRIISEPNDYIGWDGTKNERCKLKDPEDHYLQGKGLLYFSNHKYQFQALDYINTRSEILKMLPAPLFLESDHHNTILLFMKDRIDRVLLKKDTNGVLLDRRMIGNVYNQYVRYPNMAELVEGDAYFISAEGIMRFSQSGIHSLSQNVIDLKKLITGRKVETEGFIQYLPDKKQVWFCFGWNGSNTLCLVYDLRHGVFYKFLFREQFSKGFFNNNNYFMSNNNSLLVYPIKSDAKSIGRVVTKKFKNSAKLKKILTKSKFGEMIVRGTIDIRREKKRINKFKYSPNGVYILDSGFRGDLEFEFTQVEVLDGMELWMN